MATPHALVGALIAEKVGNPAIGIPVAFFSHFLFDLVPHWDWGWHPGETVSRIIDPTKKKQIFIESTLDVMIGFILTYAIFGNRVNTTYLFFMILAAQGPDWLTVPYWLFRKNFFPLNLVVAAQHKLQLHARLPWGLLNQAAAVLLFALLLHYL